MDHEFEDETNPRGISSPVYSTELPESLIVSAGRLRAKRPEGTIAVLGMKIIVVIDHSTYGVSAASLRDSIIRLIIIDRYTGFPVPVKSRILGLAWNRVMACMK